MVAQQLKRLDMIDQFEANLKGNTEDGLKVTTPQIAAAEHVRQSISADVGELVSGFDAALTPISPVPPNPVAANDPEYVGGKRLENDVDWIAPAIVVIMRGYPAASAPAGWPNSKLPVGLQISALRFKEIGFDPMPSSNCLPSAGRHLTLEWVGSEPSKPGGPFRSSYPDQPGQTGSAASGCNDLYRDCHTRCFRASAARRPAVHAEPRLAAIDQRCAACVRRV